MNTKDLTLISMFAALTAIGAFISIPLGPVPLSLQTLFVLMSGFVLGPRKGALSQLVYIALGLIGLPIFAGFSGGVQSVLRPSFGFLVGFVAGSLVTGYLSRSSKSFGRYFAAGFAGTITIYLFGLPYMTFILNYVMDSGFSVSRIFQIGMIAFLPGDTVKLITASIVGLKLKRVMIN